MQNPPKKKALKNTKGEQAERSREAERNSLAERSEHLGRESTRETEGLSKKPTKKTLLDTFTGSSTENAIGIAAEILGRRGRDCSEEPGPQASPKPKKPNVGSIAAAKVNARHPWRRRIKH